MTDVSSANESSPRRPRARKAKWPLSIRLKLIVPMSLIIMVLIGISFLATTWLIQRFQYADLEEALGRTEQVVEALLATQRQTLMQQARLVGELPILTTVVDDGDPDTIRDSAQTYQAQLQLPVFDVLDSDGEVLVSVLDELDVAKAMPTAALVQAALDGEPQVGLAWRQKRLALVATAPFGAPDEPSGVLRVGMYLDDALAAQIKHLTKADVVFVGDQGAVGSSLPRETWQALREALPHLLQDIGSDRTGSTRSWKNYLVRSIPLRDAEGQLIGHVVLQVSRAAADAVVAKLQRFFGGVAVAGFVVAVLLTSGVARSIALPLSHMATAASRIACGDLAQRIDYDADNEIGILAQALNHMALQLRQMLQDITDKATALTAAASELSVVSEHMSNNARTMSDGATTTAAAAKEMSTNMDMAVATAEQSTANTSTVATATEEMTATVSEIAQNSAKAAQVTMEAVQNVSRASSRVDELGASAREIDDVIAVIAAIADQTKLLALNATIEAARAGEAGRGFAVVANEVKELANQTNVATENIREKIEAMQRSTEGTIEEITQIDEVIRDVNDIVTTIAAAVEQQTVTTRDMASNIGRAATGLQDMTRTVSQATQISQNMAADMATLNTTSTDMGTDSGQLNTHAASLAKMGDELKEMVGRFTLEASTTPVGDNTQLQSAGISSVGPTPTAS